MKKSVAKKKVTKITTPKINPVTAPPLELLLKKAHEAEILQHPLTEYESVIKVLVQEKRFTALMVRDWLSDHGAGNFGKSVVATNISKLGKKWKAEALKAAGELGDK